MARSITFKFGADTSQLSRALGGIRKSIGGMMGGIGIRGMIGAGIAGFGIQQLIGSAMNISPTFANTMLQAEEVAVRGFARSLEQIQPQMMKLAESLPEVISGFLQGASVLAGLYASTRQTLPKASGLYTEAAMGIMNRFGTASSFGELFGPSALQFGAGFTSLTNAAGLTDVNPQALDFIEGVARRQANRGISGIGGQARTQSDPAQSADPRP